MPRTLTIHFPDGKTSEFWYTARVFEPGDKLERDGETWIVTSIGETADGAKHMTVTVQDEDSLWPFVDGNCVKAS
jgi:hypothetical protein